MQEDFGCGNEVERGGMRGIYPPRTDTRNEFVSPALTSASGQSHMSIEEIMMLRELLSRDSVLDSMKSALLAQVIDKKIEGGLKAERLRAAHEREALATQHQSDVLKLQQRVQELLEKGEAGCRKVLAQAEEERLARTQAEVEAQRASASEKSSVAHMKSSLAAARHEAEEVKIQFRELQEGAEATRKELCDMKEKLSTATVSQRLLWAYKAEKQRCQEDLQETLKTYSAPAWQAEQYMEAMEASILSTDVFLESLQSVLASRKRQMQPASRQQPLHTDMRDSVALAKRRKDQPLLEPGMSFTGAHLLGTSQSTKVQAAEIACRENSVSQTRGDEAACASTRVSGFKSQADRLSDERTVSRSNMLNVF